VTAPGPADTYQGGADVSQRKHPNATSLRRLYGMTPADYAELLEQQDGVCAICKRRPRNGRFLVVDHDHRTGLVRGLLHNRCNRLLTRALQTYIENPPGAKFAWYVPMKMALRRAHIEALKEARQRERLNPRRSGWRPSGQGPIVQSADPVLARELAARRFTLENEMDG
jgi:hypothetical protein